MSTLKRAFSSVEANISSKRDHWQIMPYANFLLHKFAIDSH